VEATTTFVVPYVEWGLHDPSMMVLRVAKTVGVTVQAKGTLSATESVPSTAAQP
jgi:hypothetical protein